MLISLNMKRKPRSIALEHISVNKALCNNMIISCVKVFLIQHTGLVFLLIGHLIHVILGFRHLEHRLLMITTSRKAFLESCSHFYLLLLFVCLILNITLAFLQYNLHCLRKRCNLHFFDSKCYKIP